MSKTLKYALGAVLGLTLAAPAFAQAPDVPERHWAYDAVRALWNKVLFGYDDGLYRGNRPANRYELAAALKKLWDVFNARATGIEDQLNALEDLVNKNSGNTGGGSTFDPTAINNAIAALRNDVNSLKGMQGDLNTLKRLTSELEAELATHGVNINAMKKDMADLDARLRRLENTSMPVTIGGEINFLMLGGHETDGLFGLMPNGRITGVGRDSYAGAPVGASRDLTGLHELALTISDNKDDDNIDWGATLVVGNLFDSLGGFSGLNMGQPYVEGNNDIYINTMWAKFSSSVFGKGLDVTVGRIGTKESKFTWQRPDYTTEFSNDRWDNGEWYLDGANLEFGFGSVDLSIWGGRNTNVDTIDDVSINPVAVGGFIIPLDNTLGFTLEANLGNNGRIRGNYIIQDSNTRVAFGPDFINRMNTAGVDVDFKFGNIDFWGSYAMTSLSENTSNTFDDDNSAWDVNLGYSTDRWGISGGMKTIEPNFFGLGDWGRIGSIYNPRNVTGYNAKLWFNANDRLKLWAKGEVLEGESNAGGILFSAPGLTEDDEATSIKLGAEFSFSDMWGMMLGYETVDFDYNVGPDVDQNWWTLGFRYGINQNSFLKVAYMVSDIDFNGRQGLFGFPNAQYKGGLISTQLGIRF